MAGRQGQTVRGAVATRNGADEQTVEQRFDFLRQDLVSQTTWFKRLLPSHMDPTQFLALCFNVVKESDWALQQALMEDPRSFFRAANDCAMMGLVPGKTYHFVAFKNKIKGRNGKPDTWKHQVTGIADYKGEIEMIYRSGAVVSIHCEVVRQNDEFAWQPGQMPIPYHRIKAPEYAPEQVGLAGEDERGYLTGVYAYAVMVGGGYSAPIVMGRTEVLKRRAISKTDAFWGPEWPSEGSWTPDMWRKTVLHALFDEVPHGAEYAANVLRQQAAITSQPREIPSAPEAEAPALATGPDTEASAPAETEGAPA